MNILILGNGGREHSLAWAIKQNPKTDQIFCAAGNAGTTDIAKSVQLNLEDGAEILTFCKKNHIDFVIIGPEAPLAAGVSDTLRDADILTFGPSKAASRLETSKAFTKEICATCNAPTAAYASFADAYTAKAYIREKGAPIVVKADGLAAGKGVIVAMNLEEALDGVDMIFDGSFGASNTSVVIEEFLTGEEASFFILSDGETLLPIGTAQDHKRVFDGDKGPNTGGMGAYSPAPIMSDDMINKTMREIITPTMKEMKRRGTPYHGVLFAGLMIEDGQPKLIEYNVRFGDPECQVLMMRLGGQVLDLLLACAKSELADMKVNWADDHALTVVMASDGYPASYSKNIKITGLSEQPKDSNYQVFHAGTTMKNNETVAVGGRVLNVTARGSNLKEAHDRAYQMASSINWDGAFYRKDIGWRAIKE